MALGSTFWNVQNIQLSNIINISFALSTVNKKMKFGQFFNKQFNLNQIPPILTTSPIIDNPQNFFEKDFIKKKL